MNRKTSLPVALLVTGVAILCGLVIASGFVAPEWAFETLGIWVYIGAVGVMIICGILSFWFDLPGTISAELR